MDTERLARLCNGWRVKGAGIVFTNGCFDVLHRGHIALLLQAAEQGDKLIIGINSDNSATRLKGPDRPVNKEDDRAFLLAALSHVDAVCLFDEDTPLALIELLQPDVLVKGGDYTADQIVGADLVKGYGGRVHIVPLAEGYSSTGTIRRMN